MDSYDEYAAGWNEIFDRDDGGAVSKTTTAAALPGSVDAAALTASRLHAKGFTLGGSSNGGGMSSSSKKPPVYLRIPGGKRSAIDKGMKERLMDCPMSRMRKPAAVMDSQLDQLRSSVAKAHQRKRQDAREMRRLQRRCRVKDWESLESLEDHYLNTPYLQPLYPDLVENARTTRLPASHVPLAKNFFVALGRRQMSPRVEVDGGAPELKAIPAIAVSPATLAASEAPSAPPTGNAAPSTPLPSTPLPIPEERRASVSRTSTATSRASVSH